MSRTVNTVRNLAAVGGSRGRLMLEFAALPLWLNLVLFGAAGAAVWAAGTRLARYADTIANRTGIRLYYLR
jgi:hypothetical protein